MSDAHCHTAAGTIARPGCETIVLVGNPNVGKSVVFNELTGTYVDVSNFPGTTVELTRGRLGEHDVIDTPGVYGVSSFNDEETVARDIILSGDIVVNVVDAVHLERDLFLTLQLIDMGKRMVVALNMADEARRRGLAVDRDLLEDLLGVPVIETVAVEGLGFDELRAAVPRARTGHADVELEADIIEMATRVGSRAEALMVLEGDEFVSERHGIEPGVDRDRHLHAPARTRQRRLRARHLRDHSRRELLGEAVARDDAPAHGHSDAARPALLHVGRAGPVDRRGRRRLPRRDDHARLLGALRGARGRLGPGPGHRSLPGPRRRVRRADDDARPTSSA